MVTGVQIWIWANYLNLTLIVLTCRIYADRLGWKMGTMLVTVRNVVCEGYVFTGVCLSTGACIPACLAGHQPGGCPGPDPRWGVCVSQHALRQTSPSRRLLLRYASYWNAFLFNIVAMGITDWIQIPSASHFLELGQHAGLVQLRLLLPPANKVWGKVIFS